MKISQLFTLLLLAGTNIAFAQQPNPSYNPSLADSLKADEYGMKMYVLVILKTGPIQITDESLRDSLFTGHLKNISRLVHEGKLVVAGPLGKNDKEYRGIFILNVPTVEEAQALLQTDPTIQAGLLEPEMYPWYGSAALPMYLPYDAKVRKKSYSN